MHVHRTHPLPLQDEPAPASLQLLLQHPKAAIRLFLVALERPLDLLRVIVPEPIHLAHHGAERADEEEGPLVVLDAGLLVVAGAEEVLAAGRGGVVYAEQVVYAGAGFPGCDGGVWVLEGGDASVGVDGSEGGAFDAVGRGAKVPEFDGVGEGEDLEGDGHFVRVGACGVGVEDEGFEGGHCGWRGIWWTWN